MDEACTSSTFHQKITQSKFCEEECFSSDRKLFFESIEKSDLSGVKGFLQKYPKVEFVLNDDGESAAAVAIDTLISIQISIEGEESDDDEYDSEDLEDDSEKDVEVGRKSPVEEELSDEIKWLKHATQIEIYETLISRGLCLNQKEIKDKFSILARPIQGQLRKLHKKYSQNSKAKHITTLIRKSKLAHDTADVNSPEYPNLIAMAFTELNAIPCVESVLKVVSTADDLNIIFDFKRSSVDHMDPSMTVRDLGLFYPSGDVYVGAKGLVDGSDDDRMKVLGNMAHELCHYAMDLVYCNSCKPYKDEDKNEEFEDVMTHCEANKEAEPFIGVVFRYHESRRHAEMIVRVPNLMALYKNNPEKIKDMEVTFSKLFEYFETKTLVDLDAAYPSMESRQKVIKLNRISRLSEIIENSNIEFRDEALNFEIVTDCVNVFSSSCPFLTMNAIYQKLIDDDNVVFMKLEALMNETMFEMIQKAFRAAANNLFVIYCEATTSTAAAEKLLSNKIEERFVLVQHSSSPTNPNISQKPISHFWSQLTDETQELLLDTKVKLQGAEVSLKALLGYDFDNHDEIPLNELIESRVEIGEELKVDNVDYYIKRTFCLRSDELAHRFRFSESPIAQAVRTENDEFMNMITGDNKSAMRKGLYRSLLKREREERKELTVDQLLTSTESERVVVLTDHPCMGKSTELKMIAVALKVKLPSHWITFVELKKFVEEYKRNGSEFKTLDDIANFFCEKILKIEGFEAKVFTHLLKTNRVVFLMDGFDEISPTYKAFNMQLLSAIKDKTLNQLWISTRPHMAEELWKNLSGITILLNAISFHEREHFVRKMLNVDGRAYEKISKGISSFLKIFENSYMNPYMLKMTVEVFEDNENTNASSCSSTNSYSTYKSFIQKMIQNCMDRGFDAKKDVSDIITNELNIMQFLQKKAVQFIIIERGFFMDDTDRDLIRSLFSNDPDEISVEQLARVGIVYFDIAGVCHFIHESFAEFLVAHYVYKKFLTGSSNDAIVKLISRTFDWEHNVVNFLEQAMGILIESKDESKLEKAVAILSKALSKNQKFLKDCIEYDRLNLIKVFAVNKEEFKLMLNCYNDHYPPIFSRVDVKSFEFFKALITAVVETLDPGTVKEILFKSDSKEKNISHWLISNRDPRLLEFLLNSPIVPLSDEEKIELLDFTSGSGRFGNLLTLMFKGDGSGHGIYIEEIRSIASVVEKKFGDNFVKKLLKATTSRNETVLLFACAGNIRMNGRDRFEELLAYLKEKLSLKEIKEMFGKFDDDGRNVMNVFQKTFHGSMTMLEIFWRLFEELFDEAERREILRKEYGDSLTTLHLASKMGGNSFAFVTSKYETLLAEEEMKEIILKENSIGENILFFVAKEQLHRSLKALWSYMITLFSREQLEQLREKKNLKGESLVQFRSYGQPASEFLTITGT